MAVMVFIAMIMMMMMMMMMMTTAIHSVLLKEDASLSNHFSGTQFFRLRHFVRGVNISDFSTEVHTTNFAVWPVPFTGAQPFHPGNGSHGQLFRPR